MKVLQFLGKLESNGKQTFGFKSPKYPPAIDELAPFESDLQRMISSIDFRPIQNKFVSKLSKDIKNIKKTKELLINADKSTNIFKMFKEDYQKYLRNNITKAYKKSNRNRENDINLDTKIIAQNLIIDDQVEKMQETEAFLPTKDHEEGFPHMLFFRLINSSKSDIGKINKSVNKSKNTSQVITSFKNIKSKKASSFVHFNVENFYPSIWIDLFTYAISYAKTITNIDDDQLSIIMQSRKTLLFNNNIPCIKKSGEEKFDLKMGCYDGVEVCELVGTYILNKLKNVTSKEKWIGNISKNTQNCNRKKEKQIVKVFKECSLTINIKCNSKSVDFLDVTFDLVNESYKPHRKSNNKPLYINKHFNHSPNILQQLSKFIEKRICETSSNIDVFNRSIKIHNDALHERIFKETIPSFTKPAPRDNDENQKRKIKRSIMWFNPLYLKKC